MGTHPIFESDFDCLTECSKWRIVFLLFKSLGLFNIKILKARFRFMRILKNIELKLIRYQHKNFEGAFSIHEDFEKYRTQIDQITTEMKKLSAEATEVRKELLLMSKEELAQIVFDIQKQEEELLIISAAYQVARSQKKPDEDDLRETRRNIRSKIAELLEDYRAELD